MDAVEKSEGSAHCIYILQKGMKKQYQIGYSPNLSEILNEVKKGEENRLLYTRIFNELIDALGHKLFLEHISTASLKRIIQKQNPKLEDLTQNMLSGYMA